MSFEAIIENKAAELASQENSTITAANLIEVARHYIAALLWSSSGEGDNEFLDQSHGIEDFSEEGLEACVVDCYKFYQRAWITLNTTVVSFEMIGHDLLLTRNGHGVGFWDRGLGKPGDELTEICKEFGEKDAYVGDDGLVYLA